MKNASCNKFGQDSIFQKKGACKMKRVHETNRNHRGRRPELSKSGYLSGCVLFMMDVRQISWQSDDDDGNPHHK